MHPLVTCQPAAGNCVLPIARQWVVVLPSKSDCHPSAGSLARPATVAKKMARSARMAAMLQTRTVALKTAKGALILMGRCRSPTANCRRKSLSINGPEIFDTMGSGDTLQAKCLELGEGFAEFCPGVLSYR